MKPVYANFIADENEIKNSAMLLEQNEPVAIFKDNQPKAYIIPAKTYEKMIEIIEDYLLSEKVKNRLKEDFIPIKVDLDEL